MSAIYCKGCNEIIQDRFLLLVEPDQLWHLGCLRCNVCKRGLEADSVCYVTRKGVLCTLDFQLHNPKSRPRTTLGYKCQDQLSPPDNSSTSLWYESQTHCARCTSRLYSHDVVCNVGKYLNFHYPQCLFCLICKMPLKPGLAVLYVLRGLICATHKLTKDCESNLSEFRTQCDFGSDAFEVNEFNQNWSFEDSGGEQTFHQFPMTWTQQSEGWYSDHDILHNPCDTTLPLAAEKLIDKRLAEFSNCSMGKQARMRTVLNERQLTALRTCYSINPRPDTSTKEQLALITGLNLRVIRVWFQNKRCKDKKCRAQTQPTSTTPDSTKSSSYDMTDYDNLDTYDLFLCD